jgi:hypothetical protein
MVKLQASTIRAATINQGESRKKHPNISCLPPLPSLAYACYLQNPSRGAESWDLDVWSTCSYPQDIEPSGKGKGQISKMGGDRE